MSLRASASLADAICSGAMNSGEPIITALFVMSTRSPPKPPALLMPKSITFTQGEPSAR
jgi:hypothetical protein